MAAAAAAAASSSSSSSVVGTPCRHAKRARTEVADPPHALSGTSTAHLNWRDWANLTAGPAGLIAEEVLADDVAGYLRFRAVCSSWRRCTPSPPHVHDGLDCRFHPRRWIMLPEVFANRIRRRDFLNVSTGERIRVDFPQLRYHFVLGPTSDGLILLCRKSTGAMCLLNPLTRQLTALPNATSLLKSQNNKWRSSTGLSKLKKLQAFNAGLIDSSTVALHFYDHELELAVAKPKDEQWSCRARSDSDSDLDSDSDSDSDSILSSLSFANRIYCVTKKSIKVVDVTTGQPPQLVLAVEDEDFRWLQSGGHLVDNDGEVIMVRPRGITQRYEVHRVDLGAGKMVSIDDLRGRAVFICDHGACHDRSVSVHAGLSSTIMADTIYRCRDYYGTDDRPPRIDACHVKNGWIKHDLRADQGSIVDYLSRYVCGSKDTVVPAPLRRRPSPEPVAGPWKRKRKLKVNSKVIGNEWVN